jgi:hypothetical protein
MAPVVSSRVAGVLHISLEARRAANGSRPQAPGAAMTTSWQPTTLVQCISVRPWLTYPGCDEPGGCHDLTLGRIYEMLGVEGSGSFYRIVDDSGEDYLYPASHFRVV